VSRRPYAPAWLVARPIAHRGLHDASQGIIENSLTAARRAIDRNYAIECDVQASKDGEAIVFHDETLARLIGVVGDIAALATKEVTRLAYKDSQEHIPTLEDFLSTVAGRVPLIVELKSRFDGDPRLARRVAQLAARYSGALALKSFDPQILCMLRKGGGENPLGLVAQARYTAEEWPGLNEPERKNLEALVDFPQVKPDFLSWHVGDLPHAVPMLCRAGMNMPVMVWTVRTDAQRVRAAQWADQIVFEGFEL
jgi:glycerophosphoryl diester phosphodiesterase